MQAAHWSQSLNRYSYVFNNPLSWTDPSGFCGATSTSNFDQYNPFGSVNGNTDYGSNSPSFNTPCPIPEQEAIIMYRIRESSSFATLALVNTAHMISASAMAGFGIGAGGGVTANGLFANSTGGGSVLGSTAGWKYLPGEPQKVGQEISPAGYIVRRQTMSVIDFLHYKPGLNQLPRIDKLPSGKTIEKMMKKAIRDICKQAGQEVGNAVARGVRVDELYRVYMSYDIYSGDQAYYEEGHEPLCCRNDVSFKVVTPGAQPVLKLIDWRYEMAPAGSGWHPGESWVAPAEIGHGWELCTPISPFTP